MIPKDRILTALSLEEPDEVPITDIINDVKIEELLGKEIRGNAAEMLVEASRKLSFDMVFTMPDALQAGGVFTTGIEGSWIDPVGREYKWDEDTKTLWYLRGLVKTEDHLDLYSPNPENEVFYETTRKVIELVGEELAVGVLIDNIELTSESMGIEYFLMSFYRNRSFVEKCLRVRTDFVIEVSKRMIDLGVDVIILGDDIADKHGPFISPENFSKHILPQYKRIVHAIHCKDTPVVCHSDGNMWPLLDLLVEADLDGFHPIEPQAGMDIKEVKQEYGYRFCLMGNVDCSHTLCIRPIDEVVEETKNCIAAAAPGGGFILSSSNSIHNAVKLDNYRSMVKVAKKYGQYPIP